MSISNHNAVLSIVNIIITENESNYNVTNNWIVHLYFPLEIILMNMFIIESKNCFSFKKNDNIGFLGTYRCFVIYKIIM